MAISVIIPFFNYARFLPQLEASLAGQGAADYEVVIVDDGSQPSELKLLRTFAAKNSWRLVELANNSGPGSARNAGIEAATGNWLLFLDADDSLAPGAITRLSNAVATHHSDVLLFDYTIERGERRSLSHTLSNHPSQLDYVDPAYAFAFAGSSTLGKLYNADFVQRRKISFGTGFRHEDTVFTKTALAWAQKVLYLPESLYDYKMHPGSLVTDASNASFEASFTAINAIMAGAPKQRPTEMEYVFIVEVVISCAMKFYPLRVHRLQARELFNRFDSIFPEWIDNKYLRNASLRYRIYANLCHRRAYLAVKAVSWLETIVRRIMRLK